MGGPLRGFKVIEMAGIGPGPFTAMMLADMGADVLRVDRPNARVLNPDKDVLNRGRRSIAVDLKHPDGVQTVLRLVEQADALLEGFRPGVMERLGLGPDECLARNPKLVYGRMTGWGQDGPLAHAAGHDINYIASPESSTTSNETVSAPYRRTTWLATSGVAASCWRSAWCARYWRRRARARARWSTPPWSTVPRCSAR